MQSSSLEVVMLSITFVILLALLAATVYQFLCFDDLENDIINPYDLAARVNALVTKEFVMQGALCALFLLTWNWFMFVMSAPFTIYHLKLYKERKHLVDVLGAFGVLKSEKQYRMVKLIFYLILFTIVMFRLVLTGAGSIIGEGAGLLGWFGIF